MKFIKLAKYAPRMIATEKAKIHRFIFGLGEHIKDTTKAATLSMEQFSSVVKFVKHLELKTQKMRADKEQNKKTHTTCGYNDALGGGVKN